MNKNIGAIIGLVVIVGVLFAVRFYVRNLQGIGPAINKPVQDIADLLPNSEDKETPIPQGESVTAVGPISVPDGFAVSIFAKDLAGARVLVKDGLGNMWVSQPDKGVVTFLQMADGKIVSQNAVFRGLRRPHGLAIDPSDKLMLYIAEENKISRVRLYSEAKPEKIADLPSGGNHTSRTIGFGPDGRLYVSIGSSCNVCNERDARRAAILSMRKDGSDVQTTATGLRNSVFFVWDTVGRMWATDMGRDLLGDDTPPDEVNIVESGKFYGWPNCYSKNVVDTTFAKTQQAKDSCATAVSPQIEIQAHSAPLGLVFVPRQWPSDWQGDLLVAYHGSWNRSVPTGYKVVRWKMNGTTPEGQEDFMTGFLQNGGALGRPVHLQADDGVLYITDDKAGVVYQVTYQK